MLEVLLPLALLGALIVSLDRLVRRGQTSSHLPSHRLSRPVFTKPGWSVELNRLSISIYTKALNDLPSQITRTLPRHVTRLYDIGAIVGIVGVAGAVFSGLWAVKDVWATVWLEAGLHAGETIIKGDEKAVNLLRRAMNNIAPVGDNGEQSGLAPLVSWGISAQGTKLTCLKDSRSHCTSVTFSDHSASSCCQPALPRARPCAVCKLVRNPSICSRQHSR
jgi:hypothetical protein